MLTWFCREQKTCPVSDIHQIEMVMISIVICMDTVVHVAGRCSEHNCFYAIAVIILDEYRRQRKGGCRGMTQDICNSDNRLPFD